MQDLNILLKHPELTAEELDFQDGNRSFELHVPSAAR